MRKNNLIKKSIAVLLVLSFFMLIYNVKNESVVYAAQNRDQLGVKIENVDQLITTVEDKKINISSNDMITVLIFAKMSGLCGNSNTVIKNVCNSSWLEDERVRAVIVDIESLSANEVKIISDKYKYSTAEFCYDTGNQAKELMWTLYHSITTDERNIVFPITFFIDQSNTIQYYQTGLMPEQEINQYICSLLNEEIEDGFYILNQPTEDEIRDYYKKNIAHRNTGTEYEENYSLEPPYNPGKLSNNTLQYGLNLLNYVRFIAGLPADVEIDPEYNELAQAGCLANELTGFLTHTPNKNKIPEMDDELFEKAYKGCSSSNLAGTGVIPSAILLQWMNDSDVNNISMVGHRRWILNPKMKKTGFGCVESITALYVFDRSRSETFTGNYVCWPAQIMPYEEYLVDIDHAYAFSLSLGDVYDKANLSDITVDIESEKLKQTWHLDKTNNDDYSCYLTVDHSNAGMPNCIIFNVGEFPKDDTVSIMVHGTTINGAEAPISYKVEFFNINENTPVPDNPSNPKDTEEPNHTEPSFIYGDVDSNRVLNAEDALLILRITAKLEPSTKNAVKVGDVDGNGSLGADDALLVLQKAARLIDVFSVEKL